MSLYLGSAMAMECPGQGDWILTVLTSSIRLVWKCPSNAPVLNSCSTVSGDTWKENLQELEPSWQLSIMRDHLLASRAFCYCDEILAKASLQKKGCV